MALLFYMVIDISIHQVADKSVYWKQAAQASQFGANWLQLICQEVWQKLSYFFDQLLEPLKSLRNPSDHVCSRTYYILWYKFQKFKMCKKVLGYALIPGAMSIPESKVEQDRINWICFCGLFLIDY